MEDKIKELEIKIADIERRLNVEHELILKQIQINSGMVKIIEELNKR